MNTKLKREMSAAQNLKRFIPLCVCVLMIINFTTPVFVYAQENQTAAVIAENNVNKAAENVASGVLGTCNWRISSDGILTIDSGNLPNNFIASPWGQYSSLIKEVRLSGEIIAGDYLNYLFDGLSNVTNIQNLNYLNTSKTTRMMYVFRNCSSLQSLDLSSWDTSKVVTFTAMFNGCRSISNLDLSTFDTSSAHSYYMMFNNCPALKVLNIRGFGKNGTTSAYDMFDASNVNLYSITVGNYTPFKSDSSRLPEHAESGAITKGWIGVNSKKYYSTTREFTRSYDGSNPDTYVWAAFVSVNYHDELGKTIHEENKLFGSLGETYDTTTSDLKLDIPGYQLDTEQLPINAVGTFQNEPQTVTYIYKKDSVKAKDLTVNYQDTDGETIAESKTISGSIGKVYDVSTDEYKLDIAGYSFKEIKGEPTGKLSDVEQTVTFVYSKDKNSIKAKGLTISYQDTERRTIAESKTISGDIGDSYDVSGDEYKLTIDGYSFKDVQGEMIGELSDLEQTVTFVYIKDKSVLKAKDLTINYQDTEGRSIAESKTISGNVGDSYDVSAAEYKLTIEGYTFKEVQGKAIGTLSVVDQTVTLVYSKDTTSIKAKDLTVNYQDENGKTLAESKTISGNIGDKYDISGTEFKLTIEGYTFKEVQGELKGILSDINQTTTFVYSKDIVKDLNKPVDKGNSSNKTNTSTNNNTNTKKALPSSEQKILPRTGQATNQWSTILGLVLVALTIFIWFFKNKSGKRTN